MDLALCDAGAACAAWGWKQGHEHPCRGTKWMQEARGPPGKGTGAARVSWGPRSRRGPRRERSLQKLAGCLQATGQKQPPGPPPLPPGPTTPELPSKTEGAISVATTTINKNKPKPLSGYDLPIA